MGMLWVGEVVRGLIVGGLCEEEGVRRGEPEEGDEAAGEVVEGEEGVVVVVEGSREVEGEEESRDKTGDDEDVDARGDVLVRAGELVEGEGLAGETEIRAGVGLLYDGEVEEEEEGAGVVDV